MKACLRSHHIHGYLADREAPALQQYVASHVSQCSRCGARVEKAVAVHRRVDALLAELESPLDDRSTDLALGRLLLASRIAQPEFALSDELPWYRTLWRSARDLLRPEKTPPLDLTSRPVQVKDIWGLYPKDPASRLYALGIHAGVFALLMFGFTNPSVQTVVKQNFALIDPVIKPWTPEPKPRPATLSGGGGGGAREALPVSKGQLPKASMKQFVPPQTVDHTPVLAMNPSILAPPDAPLPVSTLNNWGDPLAKIMNGSNGNGLGGGMGNGIGGGVGSGRDGGYGHGTGGGVGGGVFSVGGGVSAPVVLSKVDPEYSEEARKAKYSGTVALLVVVDKDGRARDIRVSRSLGLGLDEKAIEAVQKWRFRPGMKNGVAVDVRALIEVNFRLL